MGHPYNNKETLFMPIRGIRGAITVMADEPDLILQGTSEMLEAILEANPGLNPEDMASALFTVTEDLASVFPAQAARHMGWTEVPMMCSREIPVAGSLPLCIRVLILWNSDKGQKEIKHVYLRDARRLRPDLTKEQQEKPQ
jgi:chorismate mutase